MKPRNLKRRHVAGGVALGLVIVVLAQWTLWGTLPAGPVPQRVAPSLVSLPPLPICWAEMGHNESPGLAITTGWSKTAQAQVTVSSLVIQHPRGTIMIDAGDSSHIAEEIAEVPGAFNRWYMRTLPGSMPLTTTAPGMLRAIGVDPASITGVVVTHAHIDHVGGLVDLPGVPALLVPGEIEFVQTSAARHDFHVIPAHARTLQGRMQPIAMTKVPYEVFAESADLFGDGSVVVVPLPGHTPGSVGVFVNVSPARRIFPIGDTTMVREGYERPAGKGWLISLLDADRAAVASQMQLLNQLHKLVPELVILPAHDRTVWREIFGDGPRCLPPSGS